MQGFNMGRYVPPDQEGVVSANKLTGTRANKATAAGVPIVRFEMPFAVWCDGCEAQSATKQPVLIGQGVRFNAEKHRSGAYYSTPIWTFRMRHPACGTCLEIRTDPATTTYIVVSGGRRRRQYDDEALGDDPAAAAAASAAALTGIVPDPSTTTTATADDRLSAFDRLERTIAHRASVAAATTAAARAGERIDELASESARRWQDPYARNKALRAVFRAGRHAREQAASADDALRSRLGGLDIELLPESTEDARRAALIDFGPEPAAAASALDKQTLARPLFSAAANDNDKHDASSANTGRSSRDSTRKSRSVSAAAAAASAAAAAAASATTLPSTSGRHNIYAPSTELAKNKKKIRDHLASTVLTNTRLTTDPFLDSWGSVQRKAGRSGKNARAAVRQDGTPSARALFRGVKRQKQQADDTADSLVPNPGPPTPPPRQPGETPTPRQDVDATGLVSYDSDSDPDVVKAHKNDNAG